LSLFLVAAR